MFIKSQTKKMVLEVFHNSLDEMWGNIKQLEKDGWSRNTRTSVAGIPLHELELWNDKEIDEFKSLYPKIKVQDPDDSVFNNHPYVLYTIHEREFK
ncbi:hypothetical protein FH505_10575 [Bacillus velezensis]|uniref:hypothetical protein n=1 Tax=Bacillus TaxID=1386 RepID=UPI00090BABB5|nr:hypothetical protein [Bacillus velezensis]APH36070.1 hypothetical protein BHE96_10980 [Bacillus subtilis]TNU64242.1 hypothetical protein FH505_10575 [Bacillus velezensis]